MPEGAVVTVQCPGSVYDVPLRTLQVSIFFVYFAYFVAAVVGIALVSSDESAADPFLRLVVFVTAAHIVALVASHALIQDYTRAVGKDRFVVLYHVSDAVQLALFLASVVSLALVEDLPTLQTVSIASLAVLTVVQGPCFLRTYRLGYRLSGDL